MKKIVSLALCFVMAVMMLVSCTKQTIGDGIHEYPETTEKVERLDLNMYIITGDNTAKTATESVATRISGYTKVNYNTTLNITYVKAGEYETTLKNAISAGGSKVPHIVLINSLELFEELSADNKLADLTGYYESRDYGRLNTQISSSLLEASRVNGKLYTVPNNHVIGTYLDREGNKVENEYTYLVIDKEIALKALHYTNAQLLEYKSLEDAKELMDKMTAKGLDASELVRLVTGPYELREELSKDNFCNVVETPVVTKAEAFSSAFAVVNTETKYNDRAMQLIYAINNDYDLRNFLQYGVLGANYEVVNGDIVRVSSGDNVYDMNLSYTGDILKADNCSELGWTDAKRGYVIIQNSESKAEE